MLRVTTSKLIATLMVAFAMLAPGAAARPIDAPATADTTSQPQVQPREADEGVALPLGARRGAGGVADPAPNVPQEPRGIVEVPNGFDWGDAAIGAGIMLTALGAGYGALAVLRRSREGVHPATTS
jgi:hypothetical protein